MINIVKKITRTGVLAAALSAGLCFSLSVDSLQATETINMIAIDGYPERSMWVKEFSAFFIPRVNEELAKTNTYAIKLQEGYGGTIVKPRVVL